jgi:beta-phosphoglucomutase family hydrolase
MAIRVARKVDCRRGISRSARERHKDGDRPVASINSTWGVIFDMDGVLVDSSQTHYQAWSQLGALHGRPFSQDLFERTFGMHNTQIMPLWLGAETSEEKLQLLADEKEELYRALARESIAPLDGVTELVHGLVAAGARLAVGSSGPYANVSLILEILGLRDCFHALSTGDDVSHGKPHPEVFLKAAERLQLSPNRCVVIEDAPQGIEAARAAGMAVIAVTSSRPADLLPADIVVDSLARLTIAQIEGLLQD